MPAEAARWLGSRIPASPDVAVVLGSGLGGFSAKLSGAAVIPYSEIPGWPPSKVEGHAGRLAVGALSGVNVAVLEGRTHLYEGYSAAEVSFGVRAMAALGARILVVTCAAGGISPDLVPGHLVLIRDHINLQGESPLSGPKFVDMAGAYSVRLRELAREIDAELGEGVYAALRGPNYETPAEIRYLSIIGADMVGMSVVAEVIAARSLAMEVLGIACVTNVAAGVHGVSHEEVLDVGQRVGSHLARLLERLLPRIVEEA